MLNTTLTSTFLHAIITYDMQKLTKYLNQLIIGTASHAPEILSAHSTDQSIIKIPPKIVIFPESTNDIRKILKFFYQLSQRDLHFSIAIRGSGLDQTGADLSNSIVISTAKLNRLLEIDARERLVRIQSGITLKELNTALSVHGLTLPISAPDQETIGSLIANFTTDNYAGKYLGIMNYVERAEIILANGEYIQTADLSPRALTKRSQAKTLEANIYRQLPKLITQYQKLLQATRSQPKNLTGYSTVAYVSPKNSFNLLPLFFASSGSLGIISEIILKVIPLKKSYTRILVTFPKLKTTLKFLSIINALNPCELNIFDTSTAKIITKSGKTFSPLLKNLPSGFIVFASFDEKVRPISRRLTQLQKSLPKSHQIIIENPTNSTFFQTFTSNFLHASPIYPTSTHSPFLTNFYIPRPHLPNFLSDLINLEKQLQLLLPFSGSYSTSIYHLLPQLTSQIQSSPKFIIKIMQSVAQLIHHHHGTFAGGSAEGNLKALITNPQLTPDQKALYIKIKHLFDPQNILNPYLKLQANPQFTLRHIQITNPPKTML